MEKKRSEEETKKLKMQFFANFNDYTVKPYSECDFKKLHTFMFQADGDYIVVENKIGRFIVKLRDAETKRPGLPLDFNGNKVLLKVPKIPGKIYHQIISFFRDIADDMENSEAFIQIYYDKEKEEYICHVPEQIVSGASVKYNAEDNLDKKDKNRYIFVFECHSHNVMNAFWSGVDDADEKETKFYGVFGKINNEEVDEKFRFAVLGKHININKELIFDFSEENKITDYEKEAIKDLLKSKNINKDMIIELLSEKEDHEYPKEWQERITLKPLVNPTNNYITGGYIPEKYGILWGEENNKDEWFRFADTNMLTKNTSEKKEYNSEDRIEKILEEIEDIFSECHYDEETVQEIMEGFVSLLDEMHVTVLLECLINDGFDHIIQYFNKR